MVSVLIFISFVSYWNQLQISQKPGAHAASTYVYEQRGQNDAVLVSSPFIYFSILHYATEEFQAKDAPHLYSTTGELVHSAGGPILTKEDIAGPADIATYTGTVWVVDTTGFGEKPLDTPKNWREVSRAMFPEVFAHQGDIVVRKFVVK